MQLMLRLGLWDQFPLAIIEKRQRVANLYTALIELSAIDVQFARGRAIDLQLDPLGAFVEDAEHFYFREGVNHT